jgi:hypothetical protein
MASKVGDRAYNQQLSVERVLRVKKYLLSKGVPEAKVPGPDVSAIGEDGAQRHADNDEHDRAVRITLALGTKPKPLYPTIVLPPIVITSEEPPIELPPVVIIENRPRTPANVFGQNFLIKQLGSADYGLFKVLGASAMFLQIVDTDNRVEIICAGGGGEAGIGTPASVSLKGPFNPFSTSAPTEITDFVGRVMFQTPAAAGPFSTKSRITFMDLPDGASGRKSLTVPMDTGTTIGVSVAQTTFLRLVCSDPRKWDGN